MAGRPTAEKHKREDAALAGIEQEAYMCPRCLDPVEPTYEADLGRILTP